MSSSTASKTIFLLSLWLGFATSKIIELQAPLQTLSSIECVVYWQTNEYGSEETMCHRRGSIIQEGSSGEDAVLLDQYHYLELPEMLELLYQDEIEQGSLIVSVANVEIEDDQVLWDKVSDFKVLEPSNAIICRVGITQDHQTECIPIEHGIETSRRYKVNLPEPLTTQFAQTIQDGTLYLSMTGATMDGDRLIAPENESNIKVLVLEAEEE